MLCVSLHKFEKYCKYMNTTCTFFSRTLTLKIEVHAVLVIIWDASELTKWYLITV